MKLRVRCLNVIFELIKHLCYGSNMNGISFIVITVYITQMFYNTPIPLYKNSNVWQFTNVNIFSFSCKYTYIYIYIYICVCVCVWWSVWGKYEVEYLTDKTQCIFNSIIVNCTKNCIWSLPMTLNDNGCH